MDNSMLIMMYFICTTLITVKWIVADKSVQFPGSTNSITIPSLLHRLTPYPSDLQAKSEVDFRNYKRGEHVLVPRQLSQQQIQQQPGKGISNNPRRLRSPTVIYSSDFDDILDFSADVLTHIGTIINGRPIITTGVSRPAAHLIPPRPGRNIEFRPNYQPINQTPNYYPRTMLTLPHVQRLHEFRPKQFFYTTQRPKITLNRPLSSSIFGPSKTRPLSTNIFHPSQSRPTSSVIFPEPINEQRPLATTIFSPMHSNGNRRRRPLTSNIFPK